MQFGPWEPKLCQFYWKMKDFVIFELKTPKMRILVQFFTKTGITLVPMDQIAKFLCLNISTFICPSAGINKSVKNKIWILVSRGQTFYFAPKYPHFSLKISKTVFSQNFPKVWFNGQRMWDHTYMDDHYQLSNLLIRKISCGRCARGACILTIVQVVGVLL